MENALEETLYLIKKYKVEANKKLGQNFLVDNNVIEKIINQAEITKNDLIIEIGPGMGILTKQLLLKAHTVCAIELDKNMIEILKDKFKSYKNLKIINQDILKVNLQDLIEKEKKENSDIKNIKIVANLPYYISTPIIMKLLKENLKIDCIIVMVQKEVADRLIANTGTKNCGAITYVVDYYSNASEILEVTKESFIPSPKVESKVIKLKIRDKNKVNVLNKKLFFDIIKVSFMQRRKTLVNALVNGNILKNKEIANQLLKDIGIDENIRGERLKIEEFAKIADYIEGKK